MRGSHIIPAVLGTLRKGKVDRIRLLGATREHPLLVQGNIDHRGLGYGCGVAAVLVLVFIFCVVVIQVRGLSLARGVHVACGAQLRVRPKLRVFGNNVSVHSGTHAVLVQHRVSVHGAVHLLFARELPSLRGRHLARIAVLPRARTTQAALDYDAFLHWHVEALGVCVPVEGNPYRSRVLGSNHYVHRVVGPSLNMSLGRTDNELPIEVSIGKVGVIPSAIGQVDGCLSLTVGSVSRELVGIAGKARDVVVHHHPHVGRRLCVGLVLPYGHGHFVHDVGAYALLQARVERQRVVVVCLRKVVVLVPDAPHPALEVEVELHVVVVVRRTLGVYAVATRIVLPRAGMYRIGRPVEGVYVVLVFVQPRGVVRSALRKLIERHERAYLDVPEA